MTAERPSRRATAGTSRIVAVGVAALVAALVIGAFLPAWAFMWLLASVVYAATKWLTWRRAVARFGRPAGPGRAAAYLLGWPGMDPLPFLRPTDEHLPAPSRAAWGAAIGKTLAGAAIVWGIVRLVPAEHPLLRGWIAMLGLILLLHCGAFHGLALCWRARGIDVRPLMNKPHRSNSVAEFWGARWNVAFRDLAHTFVFRPLRRRWGASAATLAAFVVSGLVHDLVISVPAAGGFGLPTAYFLGQGAAILFERSAPGRRMGLGRGAAGWIFTALITAGPVVLCFHPPFVHRVMIPFLHAIGAT